ncbi:MAG: N-acetylmuramoyl-L-alanine amidase [Rubellimicrobium sp.]|nr:N-acetylmuramoyl-L-alanine amidase [Rubellimicrobium sp.]
MIFQGNARYPVREVVLHCAAIRTGQFDGMSGFQVFSTINRWHVERGFTGFGYHGLFMPDGTWVSGRNFERIGAHCLERNRGSLGFLLIESRKVERVGQFWDWFTTAQWRALRAKIAEIDGIERVTGHNDYAEKLCPGFKVKQEDWLPVF